MAISWEASGISSAVSATTSADAVITITADTDYLVAFGGGKYAPTAMNFDSTGGSPIAMTASAALDSTTGAAMTLYYLSNASIPAAGTYTVTGQFGTASGEAAVGIMAFKGAKAQAPEASAFVTVSSSSAGVRDLAITPLTATAMLAGAAMIFETSAVGYSLDLATDTTGGQTSRGTIEGNINEFDMASKLMSSSAANFLRWTYDSSYTGDKFVAAVVALEPEAGPSVVLNTPGDSTTVSDTTPTLDFTGTDANGHDVRYNVQLSTTAFADITVDAVSNSGVQADTSSFNWNHTVTGSGANRMLVVCLQYRDAGSGEIGASGVTYNSDAMTLMHSKQDYSTNASAYLRSEIWGLVNPDTGSAYAIAVTCNGANSHATGQAISLLNVQQSTTENANADGFQPTNDVNDPSVAPTSTIPNSIFIDSVYSLTTYDQLTVGTGQTVISAKMAPNAGGDESASSYEIATAKGATTMSWTTPGAGAGMDAWVSSAVALAPVGTFTDVVSGTDLGFANPDTGGDTDPFNSGENIQYTVQDALTDMTTYYWRVRAIDPNGGNQYGAWTTAYSFNLNTGGEPPPTAGSANAYITTNPFFWGP
jgi:hypothetical protein